MVKFGKITKSIKDYCDLTFDPATSFSLFRIQQSHRQFRNNLKDLKSFFPSGHTVPLSVYIHLFL